MLEELGRARRRSAELTELGRELARLPVDPRIGRMILAGARATALSRGADHRRGAWHPGPARAAAQAQARGRRPRARRVPRRRLRLPAAHEAVGVLRCEGSCTRSRTASSASAAASSFLSYVRMREWRDVHGQLARMARRDGRPRQRRARGRRAGPPGAPPGAARQRGPGSGGRRRSTSARADALPLCRVGLAKNRPRWVMAAELRGDVARCSRATWRAWSRTWLERARRARADARTASRTGSKRRRRSMANENVTLLRAADRRAAAGCSYGPHRPEGARALHRARAGGGESSTRRRPFVAHNRALVRRGASGCATRRAAATCSWTTTRWRVLRGAGAGGRAQRQDVRGVVAARRGARSRGCSASRASDVMRHGRGVLTPRRSSRSELACGGVGAAARLPLRAGTTPWTA